MGMNNVFAGIGHGVEVAVKDVLHGAKDVLSVGGKVLKVISDVKAMSPEFKSNLATIVDDAKAIAVPLRQLWQPAEKMSQPISWRWRRLLRMC